MSTSCGVGVHLKIGRLAAFLVKTFLANTVKPEDNFAKSDLQCPSYLRFSGSVMHIVKAALKDFELLEVRHGTCSGIGVKRICLTTYPVFKGIVPSRRLKWTSDILDLHQLPPGKLLYKTFKACWLVDSEISPGFSCCLRPLAWTRYRDWIMKYGTMEW